MGILLLFVSLASAAPLQWPVNVVEKFKTFKTMQEMVCPEVDTNTGKEMCDVYKGGVGKKPGPRFEVVNDYTVAFTSGKNKATVARGEKETEFLINGHALNLENYRSQKELAQGIAGALSQKPVASYWLIDSANAAEDPALAAAVHRLLILTREARNCDSYKALAKNCLPDLKTLYTNLEKWDRQKKAKDIEAQIRDLGMKLSTIGVSTPKYSTAYECACLKEDRDPKCPPSNKPEFGKSELEFQFRRCEQMVLKVRQGAEAWPLDRSESEKWFKSIENYIRDVEKNPSVIKPSTSPGSTTTK